MSKRNPNICRKPYSPKRITRYPRNSVLFHVGPLEYRLVISDRRIYDNRGVELEGLAVEGRRLLIIPYVVELERREEIALHELGHAHLFHYTKPQTDEERCQFFGITAKQYRIDMEREGGEERIKRLRPQRIPHNASPLIDATWEDRLVDC